MNLRCLLSKGITFIQDFFEKHYKVYKVKHFEESVCNGKLHPVDPGQLHGLVLGDLSLGLFVTHLM